MRLNHNSLTNETLINVVPITVWTCWQTSHYSFVGEHGPFILYVSWDTSITVTVSYKIGILYKICIHHSIIIHWKILQIFFQLSLAKRSANFAWYILMCCNEKWYHQWMASGPHGQNGTFVLWPVAVEHSHEAEDVKVPFMEGSTVQDNGMMNNCVTLSHAQVSSLWISLSARYCLWFSISLSMGKWYNNLHALIHVLTADLGVMFVAVFCNQLNNHILTYCWIV